MDEQARPTVGRKEFDALLDKMIADIVPGMLVSNALRATAAAADPRAENCKMFRTDTNNRVVGVLLPWKENEGTRYRLAKIELIDENNAGGNRVAKCIVLDAAGQQSAQQVSLAWPWPNLHTFALPGNPNGEHPTENTYMPPAIGPLALCIRDASGAIDSDVIGGLGLPDNRHVSFLAIFQERGADDVPYDPPVDPPPAQDGDVAAALDRLTATVREALRLP